MKKLLKFYKIIFTILIIFSLKINALAQVNASNAHIFSFENIDGSKINMADFKGKVVLVVNTASQCGFTPQYGALQRIYKKYQDKGLVIVAVPSADFANQEFATNKQVQDFTEKEFNITFDITSINKVTGDNAHPFYLWANNRFGFFGAPKWNFHKYLIDKNGNLDSWFSSTTKPDSDKIINRIEELL